MLLGLLEEDGFLFRSTLLSNIEISRPYVRQGSFLAGAYREAEYKEGRTVLSRQKNVLFFLWGGGGGVFLTSWYAGCILFAPRGCWSGLLVHGS